MGVREFLLGARRGGEPLLRVRPSFSGFVIQRWYGVLQGGWGLAEDEMNPFGGGITRFQTELEAQKTIDRSLAAYSRNDR